MTIYTYMYILNIKVVNFVLQIPFAQRISNYFILIRTNRSMKTVF